MIRHAVMDARDSNHDCGDAPFTNRFASRAVYSNTFAGIVPFGRLLSQHLASRLDRAQATLAPRFGYAAFAMTTPALENRLAAHRACGRYTRRRLHGLCPILALRTDAVVRRDEALSTTPI
jgi:hypothetical protein